MARLRKMTLGLAACAMLAAGMAMAAGPVVVRVVPPADAVRVDPDAVSPNRLRPGRVVQPGRTVLVPQARTTFGTATPPRGYRRAWDDGRLNPLRGPRMLEGDFQSRGIWTDDTPRRLRSVIRIAR